MIDLDGKWVVEPSYIILRRFDGAELSVFRRGLSFGAVDRRSKEVIPAKFSCLCNFAANGLAPASVDGGHGQTNEGRWGYIDRTGHFVIPE